MRKLIGFVLLLEISLANASANGTNNDFDRICQIYHDAYQQESFSKLNPSEQASYIYQKVEETVQPGDALEAFQAVTQADPNEKYQLFKRAAEMLMGKPWDCPAIKEADLSY